MNHERLEIFLLSAAAVLPAAALPGCGGCRESSLSGDAEAAPDGADESQPPVDGAPDSWDGADDAAAIEEGAEDVSPEIDGDSRRECLRDMDVRLAFRLDGEAIVPPMSVDAPARIVEVQSPDAWSTLISLEYSIGTEPPQVHELAVEAHPSVLTLQIYPGQEVRFRLAAVAEWEFGASVWLAISTERTPGHEALLVGGLDGDNLSPPADGFWEPLDVSTADGVCLVYDDGCGEVEPVALQVTHMLLGLSVLAFPDDYMVGLRVDETCDYKISVGESYLRHPPYCPDAEPGWFQAIFAFNCE